MHVGDGVVILESATQKTTWNTPATHGIYVYVEDVDAQFRRAQTAGAKIVRKIEETIWRDGTRSFRVLDPEGYQWSFGNYKPSSAGR
jgi:PhnB protein